MSMSQGISHFLNCLLCGATVPLPSISEELHSRNSKKKGKKRVRPSGNNNNDNGDWTTLTPKILWQQIKQELKVIFQNLIFIYIINPLL